MIDAKTLSDEQIASIRSWAEGGDGLPEIQRRLAEELSLKATYLETRFLLDDLGIELLPEPEPEAGEEEEADESPAEGETEGDADGGTSPEGDGASVSVDQVQRPGAMVSGQARFAGGKALAWWIDQFGRLGVDPPADGFKPSEAQMASFQQALHEELRRSGFA